MLKVEHVRQIFLINLGQPAPVQPKHKIFPDKFRTIFNFRPNFFGPPSPFSPRVGRFSSIYLRESIGVPNFLLTFFNKFLLFLISNIEGQHVLGAARRVVLLCQRGTAPTTVYIHTSILLANALAVFVLVLSCFVLCVQPESIDTLLCFSLCLDYYDVWIVEDTVSRVTHS